MSKLWNQLLPSARTASRAATAIATDFSLDIKPLPNLGRFAAIWVTTNGVRHILYGTVMDVVTGTDQPKRIRVQRGDPALAGEVLMPNEYEFAWWADEEED